MEILYELEKPFDYSWKLVIILGILIGVVITIYILLKLKPLFLKKFLNAAKQVQIPNYKRYYVFRLERLMNDVKKGKIDNREAYVKLSVLIREFIWKVSGINVLSLSREEVKKMNMKELSLLMDEYYPPEFSKYSRGDIINSITRTIEVIKKWN